MPKINLTDPQTIVFIEGLAVDLIGWFRKRHAETGQLPTNEETVARVKGKIAAGNTEFEEWERENPEPPTT